MIRLCIFYFLFMMGLFLNTLSAQDQLIEFESDGTYPFLIKVPEPMEEVTKDIKTAVGPLSAYTYVHQGYEVDVIQIVLVNVVPYPDSTFHADSLQLKSEFLNASLETLSKHIGGSIQYSLEAKHKNLSGKQFRISYNEGNAICKGMVFIDGQMMITIQVFTHVDDSLNDMVEEIISSFTPLLQ